MSKKPTWTDVKNVLKEMNAPQLRGILKDLYGLNKDNKTFFQSRFLSTQDGNNHLDPYKVRIEKAMTVYDPWSQTMKLSEARKAINEFKKANGEKDNLIELMLYYVKFGNDFLKAYGLFDRRIFDSTKSMLLSIVDMITKEKDQNLSKKYTPLVKTELKFLLSFVWEDSIPLKEALMKLENDNEKTS